MSAEPYTREEIDTIRRNIDEIERNELVNEDRRWLATVDARDELLKEAANKLRRVDEYSNEGNLDAAELAEVIESALEVKTVSGGRKIRDPNTY